MFYEPKKNDHGLSKNPFKSCTVPRVIGWISTKNEDGSDNLAPYSQFTNLTFDPPMVIFAANQNVFGDRKNTVPTIARTGEFVYNMVSDDPPDAMPASSIAKLPEAPSQLIDVARVAESPIQYECKYVTTFRLPANGGISTIDCIVGEVIGIHIKDEVFTPDGKVDICKIRPVARLGYFDYTVVEKSFEMPAPRVSPKDQVLVDKGLEGKV